LKYYAKKVGNAYPEHLNLNLLPHLCLASICDILISEILTRRLSSGGIKAKDTGKRKNSKQGMNFRSAMVPAVCSNL
jgi:hypothetical protein